jgi:5-methylcytosine-specific restriction endonuclease McrA
MPMRPMRPCMECGTLTTTARCPQHTHVAPTFRRTFYASRQWRTFRSAYLAVHPMCACGCGRPAEDVHHLHPIAAGGDPFDPANLQALSHACHSRVTNRGK